MCSVYFGYCFYDALINHMVNLLSKLASHSKNTKKWLSE